MGTTLSELRLVDVLDIVIVAVLLWTAIAWVREARARVALGGIATVVVLFWIARSLELRLTTQILQGFIALAALLLVVVFQDDLRRFFESITLWLTGSVTPRPSDDVLEELATVCFAMARRRIGALFVLPGREPVDRLLDGGTYLDGRVSEPLLWSLLDPGTPGHDGALLIRAGRVARFGVHLPLSTDWAEIGGGGTRHAAGLGLSERSDALCIVVSEERGEVSVALGGRLERIPDAVGLRERLGVFLRRTARRRREPWLASRLARARRHWREGLVATAITAGLWVHLVAGSAVGQSAHRIPVVIENVPRGYRVAEIDPPEVEVVFEGRRRDIPSSGEEGLQVRLDGGQVEPGRRTVVIDEEVVDHPPELRIVKVEPGSVRHPRQPHGFNRGGWPVAGRAGQRRERRCSRPSIPRSVSQVSARRTKAIVMLISSNGADLTTRPQEFAGNLAFRESSEAVVATGAP